MNKTILFILLFVVSITSYSQVNEAKSKAYYFSAEKSYEDNKYSEALNLLSKSEEAGGASNEYIESLRVLCYGGQKKWVKAQESLEVCYSFKPSNDILKKLSPVIIRMDDEIEKEKEKEEKKIARRKELKGKASYYENYKGWGKVTENGNVGFVDSQGNIIIPIEYKSAYSGRYGNTIVMKLHNGNYSFYKGNELLFSNYTYFSYIENCNHKLIAVYKNEILGGGGLYSTKLKEWVLKPYSMSGFESRVENGVLIYYKEDDDKYDKKSYINISKYL